MSKKVFIILFLFLGQSLGEDSPKAMSIFKAFEASPRYFSPPVVSRILRFQGNHDETTIFNLCIKCESRVIPPSPPLPPTVTFEFGDAQATIQDCVK